MRVWLFVLIENVREIAEPRDEGHDPAFAQRIDGWIGDLAEVLAKEVMQAAVVV